MEEETGYRSDDLEWLITIRTTVEFCNEKIDIYVAKNLIKSHQHLDEDEFINVEAYSVEELSRMILEGKIEDSKTISAIMSYKDKYCRKFSPWLFRYGIRANGGLASCTKKGYYVCIPGGVHILYK